MTVLRGVMPGVRMLACGTKVRTGPGEDDFTAVEDLAAGGAIFDPLARRHVDILSMTCLTLDRGKARERGLEVLVLTRAEGRLTCLVESRDLSPAHRREPPRVEAGPQQVYYGLWLDGRAVVDTGMGLCALR